MAEREYDLLVIGAGAAGGAAATGAAREGRRVAMVERNKLGGTCLNYGCDPTKTMLQAAELLHQARQAARYGLHIPEADLDWNGLLARIEQVKTKMRGGEPDEAEANLKKQGVELLKGEARFVSPHELEIEGERVRAARIVIASGTVAAIPPVDGLDETNCITNVEAVMLASLPHRLAILGGGPIGLEFAQLFRRFGVKITVLERSPTLLDTEDRELADLLCNLLRDEGIRLESKAELKRVACVEGGKQLYITYEDGKTEELVVDEILVATGRQPVLKPLNLEAAGVETTKQGVKVDKTLRTNVPHIWAAGDITGGYQFTHVAEAQGKLVAQNAFSDKPQPFDDRAIPWATYTRPELAHLGKTEQELEQAGVKYRVARYNLTELERAIIENETAGMVKLLVDEQGKLLGGHILAPGAGDLIAPLVVAMQANLPVSVLAQAIQPYPTMAEAIQRAAEGLEG